jgi:excinuclease UvrABC nuclease subunit
MIPLVDAGFADLTVLMHCAVYALVRKGEVVYIGQSKSVGERLRTHCRQRKGGVRKSGMFSNRIKVGFAFDSIWVRSCMLGELDELERSMIKRFQPKHNVKHMPPPPSISLEMLIDMMPTYPMLPAMMEPRRPSWRRL